MYEAQDTVKGIVSLTVVGAMGYILFLELKNRRTKLEKKSFFEYRGYMARGIMFVSLSFFAFWLSLKSALLALTVHSFHFEDPDTFAQMNWIVAVTIAFMGFFSAFRAWLDFGVAREQKRKNLNS